MSRTNSNTIPGVKQIKKKSGKVYYRHRKTQQTINAQYPSAEFDAEVARLDALAAARAGGERPPMPGSLGALIELFRDSPEFTEKLAPRTRKDYSHKLDYLKPGQHALLKDFTRGDVLRIRDKAHKAKKFHFANYLTTVMSVMFKWAVDREYMTFNPAAGIAKIERPKLLPKRNRVWTEAEREVVLAESSGGIRTAVGIGIWASPREQDVVAMTWASVGKDGWLRWVQQKTGDKQEWPIHSRLAAILEEAKTGEVVPLPSAHIVIGERSGKPYTEDGFRAVFYRLLRRLEREGKIGPGLTFHGLRHTMGATLATRGASTRAIQTALGHRTMVMAEHYSKEYSRTEVAQAAISLLDPPGRT